MGGGKVWSEFMIYLPYGSGTLCKRISRKDRLWKAISRSTDSNKDSLGRPVLEGFLLCYPACGADTDRGQRQPLETDTSTEWAGKQESVWTRVTCVVSKIHWFDGLYSNIYIWCNMRYLVMCIAGLQIYSEDRSFDECRNAECIVLGLLFECFVPCTF